jgi:hypothetical protein
MGVVFGVQAVMYRFMDFNWDLCIADDEYDIAETAGLVCARVARHVLGIYLILSLLQNLSWYNK